VSGEFNRVWSLITRLVSVWVSFLITCLVSLIAFGVSFNHVYGELNHACELISV
jgi:hypothetical protein